MTIELLYLLPIVALSVFIPVMVIAAQHTYKSDTPAPEGKERTRNKSELTRQVVDFNTGAGASETTPGYITDAHLTEIEKTIQLVTRELARQQKIIEESQGINEEYSRQMQGVMRRLNRLKHEYDSVLSENYSLRIKINKLMRQKDKSGDITQEFFVKGSDGSSTDSRI
jgi:hypothetical protein